MSGGLAAKRARNAPAFRVSALGVLLALAIALHVVEGFVPSPLPFARAGLANVVTVFVLLAFGFRDALLLTVLRVVIGSLLAGTFLGPAFALSLAGGLAAVTAMGVLSRLAMPPLGVVGLSVAGAACHNCAQLAVVAWLFTGGRAAVVMLPAALLVSAAAGLVTGLVAHFALARLRSSLRPSGNTGFDIGRLA